VIEIQMANRQVGLPQSGDPPEYRPCPQPLLARIPLEQPLHRGSVRLAPKETLPGLDALGLLNPHHLDEVTPKLTERLEIMKNQPASMERHMAVPELHQLREVKICRLHLNALKTKDWATILRG
jgi:hypothetical protein